MYSAWKSGHVTGNTHAYTLHSYCVCTLRKYVHTHAHGAFPSLPAEMAASRSAAVLGRVVGVLERPMHEHVAVFPVSCRLKHFKESSDDSLNLKHATPFPTQWWRRVMCFVYRSQVVRQHGAELRRWEWSYIPHNKL